MRREGSYDSALRVLEVLARGIGPCGDRGVVRGAAHALGERAEDILAVDLAEAGRREDHIERDVDRGANNEAERPRKVVDVRPAL